MLVCVFITPIPFHLNEEATMLIVLCSLALVIRESFGESWIWSQRRWSVRLWPLRIMHTQAKISLLSFSFLWITLDRIGLDFTEQNSKGQRTQSKQSKYHPPPPGTMYNFTWNIFFGVLFLYVELECHGSWFLDKLLPPWVYSECLDQSWR